jgi:hypothetical protein
MEMKELTPVNIQDLDTPGVYRIFLFDSKGKPCTINRFIGSDSSGLIYIGAAEKTTIRYRLNAFLRSMDAAYRQDNHSGGKKVANNDRLREYIQDRRLFFSVECCEDAKVKELDAIKEYVKGFGEVPPLNG